MTAARPTQIGLEERHHDLRQAVRSFAEDTIAPVVEDYEAAGEFPHDIMAAVADAGFHGIPYPEADGGDGYDYRSMAIVQEELARVWKLPAGVLNVAWTLVGNGIYEHGSAWQREEWLRPLLTGDAIGALAMTEPGAGSDASNMATTAECTDGEWVIDGHKHWTSFGEVADVLVVLARTGEDRHDLSLIGVPMPTPGERDGVEFVRDIDTMEGAAGIENEIEFSDLRVPEENLIGDRDEGFTYIMESLDLGRIGTAGQAVGIAQGAFEAAQSFADDREQFGRPIRSFQGIGFKLADMKIQIDAARLLTVQAAHTRDQGESASMEAAMAKTHATDTAMETTTEAVQVHGARGYSTEYPVERYMREAKGTQIYEGTNEINRVVIADRLYE